MAKCILTIDDSRNIFLWASLAEKAGELGFRVCLAVDLLGLDKDKIRFMKTYSDEGHEVCCHTTSHANLQGKNKNFISKELTSSKDILEQILGKECKTIIYPHGLYDSKVIKIAKEVGFKYGRITSARKFGKPISVKETNLMTISGINLPRDVSDRNATEAVESWVNKAINNDWLFCLYAHSRNDFSFKDWVRVFKVLSGYREFIEVLTFNQL